MREKQRNPDLLISHSPIWLYRNVAYAQADRCRFALHIGEFCLMLGTPPIGEHGPRLELFTPRHRFRWSKGRSKRRES